jgi:hypothetical protein
VGLQSSADESSHQGEDRGLPASDFKDLGRSPPRGARHEGTRPWHCLPPSTPVTGGERQYRSSEDGSNQVVNEVPQPQEDFAFGLLNLKPAPVTDETKSTLVPSRYLLLRASVVMRTPSCSHT